MTQAKSKCLALPMDNEKPKRRVRYSGTHPKAFKDKYKAENNGVEINKKNQSNTLFMKCPTN